MGFFKVLNSEISDIAGETFNLILRESDLKLFLKTTSGKSKIKNLNSKYIFINLNENVRKRLKYDVAIKPQNYNRHKQRSNDLIVLYFDKI